MFYTHSYNCQISFSLGVLENSLKLYSCKNWPSYFSIYFYIVQAPVPLSFNKLLHTSGGLINVLNVTLTHSHYLYDREDFNN